METELARTFLTVVETGSFVEAAQRLHLTQSAVSARIQRLEEQLGAMLFARRPGGCEITTAGRQFQRHAASLSRIVEQARQEIGAAGRFGTTLTIGARIGLWEDLLSGWLVGFASRMPDVAVHAFAGFEDDLTQALIQGRADIAVMYVPQPGPGLKIEHLFDERLVLASTDPRLSDACAPGYVYVDWGAEFGAWHARTLPAFDGAAVTVNTARLGLEHVLTHGGSGYFPLRLLRGALDAHALHRIAGAPGFRLPVYLCSSPQADRDRVGIALEGIRDATAAIRDFDP